MELKTLVGLTYSNQDNSCKLQTPNKFVKNMAASSTNHNPRKIHFG